MVVFFSCNWQSWDLILTCCIGQGQSIIHSFDRENDILRCNSYNKGHSWQENNAVNFCLERFPLDIHGQFETWALVMFIFKVNQISVSFSFNWAVLKFKTKQNNEKAHKQNWVILLSLWHDLRVLGYNHCITVTIFIHIDTCRFIYIFLFHLYVA